MTDRIMCLDTTILVKYLAPDEQDDSATRLVELALLEESRWVAPAWAWAETGSVLRKKMRSGLLQADEADASWIDFLALPISFIDMLALRVRAWELAERYAFPTLYDAGFLACTELAPGEAGSSREFWTADRMLLRSLATAMPEYVHELR